MPHLSLFNPHCHQIQRQVSNRLREHFSQPQSGAPIAARRPGRAHSVRLLSNILARHSQVQRLRSLCGLKTIIGNAFNTVPVSSSPTAMSEGSGRSLALVSSLPSRTWGISSNGRMTLAKRGRTHSFLRSSALSLAIHSDSANTHATFNSLHAYAI